MRRIDGDDILGILMVWTIVAWIGMIFGLHIGWWDLLGIGIPSDPRYPTQ